MKHTFIIRLSLLALVLLVVLLAAAPSLQAAPLLTCNSNGTGNWNTAGTWSCGRVPTSADDVTIQAGHTVTIAAAPTNGTIQSLTVNGTLTFNDNSDLTLTVTGNVVIANGGVLNVVNQTGNNNHSFNINGNLTINGTATLADGTTDSIIITLGNNSVLTVNGTLDFGTNNTSYIRTGNNVPATLTMGPNGLIRTINNNGLGPGTNTSLRTQGTGAWTTTSIGSAGTVEYYATAAQTVTDRVYNNLTISGSGTKTLTRTANGSANINGSVVIAGTATFALAGNFTSNVSGDWTRASTASFSNTAGTVVFNRAGTATLSITGATAATETFCRLTINSGTLLDTQDDFVAVSTAGGCNVMTVTGALRRQAPAQTITSGGATVAFRDSRNITTTLVTQTSAPNFGLTNYTVTINQSPSTVTCGSTTLGGQPVLRHFNITPTTLGGAATLRLYYNNNELNGNTSNQVAIYHCNGTTWERLTGSYSFGSDAAGLYVELPGVTQFSPFAIGGAPGSPTAVSLSSFGAQDATMDYVTLIGVTLGAITLLSGAWALARRQRN